MRLIDVDALIEQMEADAEHMDEPYAKMMYCAAISVVRHTPTIKLERKTGRWIPCSERLPFAEYGESDKVLATCGYLNVEDTSVRWIRELYFNGGNWCYLTGETYGQKVYAWMPLPECYQEDI